MTAKDTSDAKLRDRSVALMADSFSTQKNNVTARYIRLSKSINKLPPIDHAVKIKKRADGMFVLQIPCDSSYTRRVSLAKPDAICGSDPGGSTFATVYNPTNANAFQVGLEEDKRSVMRQWHNKIDETLASRCRSESIAAKGAGRYNLATEKTTPETQDLR
ncbi:MAG: hypothetical protein ABW185_00420 [Sedimenticola sp.]